MPSCRATAVYGIRVYQVAPPDNVIGTKTTIHNNNTNKDTFIDTGSTERLRHYVMERFDTAMSNSMHPLVPQTAFLAFTNRSRRRKTTTWNTTATQISSRILPTSPKTKSLPKPLLCHLLKQLRHAQNRHDDGSERARRLYRSSCLIRQTIHRQKSPTGRPDIQTLTPFSYLVNNSECVADHKVQSKSSWFHPTNPMSRRSYFALSIALSVDFQSTAHAQLSSPTALRATVDEHLAPTAPVPKQYRESCLEKRHNTTAPYGSSNKYRRGEPAPKPFLNVPRKYVDIWTMMSTTPK